MGHHRSGSSSSSSSSSSDGHGHHKKKDKKHNKHEKHGGHVPAPFGFPGNFAQPASSHGSDIHRDVAHDAHGGHAPGFGMPDGHGYRAPPPIGGIGMMHSAGYPPPHGAPPGAPAFPNPSGAPSPYGTSPVGGFDVAGHNRDVTPHGPGAHPPFGTPQASFPSPSGPPPSSYPPPSGPPPSSFPNAPPLGGAPSPYPPPYSPPPGPVQNATAARGAPPPSGYRVPLTTSGAFASPQQAGQPVSFDADGRTPVFLGSAIMGNAVHPCKVVPSLSPPCRVPYAGREHEHNGRYDLLPFDPHTMEWVHTERGKVPVGRRPVEGGYEEHGGKLYHAMAKVHGVKVPGKAGEHLRGCNVAFGGQEHSIDKDYEILCWK